MGSEIVLDASIAVRYAVKGEPFRQKARRFVGDCGQQGVRLLAPPLFESEADSAIRWYVHQGTLTRAAGHTAQTILNSLPVHLRSDPRVRPRAREIAEQFSQDRVYDSTYAALAEVLGCEFWTADKAFYDAVKGSLTFVHYLGDY
jgi:predicted nucleic acid-binding protein